MPNFEFLAGTVPQIRKGSQNSKIGSRDPLVTPIDLIFHFFSLVPLGVHLRAKFRVSSFNRSRDTELVPKFQNWVTWPLLSPNELFFHFCSLFPLRVHLRAKFRIYICSWSTYAASRNQQMTSRSHTNNYNVLYILCDRCTSSVYISNVSENDI